MKLLFVTFLLAFGLLSLIISIDLVMGTKLFSLVQKETNPFQVMEPSEYAVLFLFAFFLTGTAIMSFLKKRKKTPQGK